MTRLSSPLPEIGYFSVRAGMAFEPGQTHMISVSVREYFLPEFFRPCPETAQRFDVVSIHIGGHVLPYVSGPAYAIDELPVVTSARPDIEINVLLKNISDEPFRPCVAFKGKIGTR